MLQIIQSLSRAHAHTCHTFLCFVNVPCFDSVGLTPMTPSIRNPDVFPVLLYSRLMTGGAAARHVPRFSDSGPVARLGPRRPLRGSKRSTGGYANTHREKKTAGWVWWPRPDSRRTTAGALRASLCCSEKEPLVFLLRQSEREMGSDPRGCPPTPTPTTPGSHTVKAEVLSCGK